MPHQPASAGLPPSNFTAAPNNFGLTQSQNLNSSSPDRLIRIRKDPIKNSNLKRPGLTNFEEAMLRQPLMQNDNLKRDMLGRIDPGTTFQYRLPAWDLQNTGQLTQGNACKYEQRSFMKTKQL
jgi:hypothetical protein